MSRRNASRTKGMKRRSSRGPQLKASFAVPPERNTRARIHFYSRPQRRVSTLGAVRPRSTSVRVSAIVGGAVAGAAIGAVMGSVANEAGLLNAVPAQNKVGISATGLIGIGLIVIGFFVKTEGMKLLFYSLGGGLVIEEASRQIDMRFYDFRVAFAGAPALNYEQGISGAQLQLAQMSAPAREPMQLPPAQGPAPAQGTLTRTPQTSERHNVPPAPGPGEDFANRPGTPPRVPRGVFNRNQGASVASRDHRGNWQHPPESQDDQDFGPRIATNGLDIDPSAMYRHALRTAGQSLPNDPSALYRYALRTA